MLKKCSKENLLEGLFFLSFILFLISAMIETTTFSSIPLFLRLSSYLRKGAWLLAAGKILLQGIHDLRAGTKKIDWINVAFFAAMVICYYFSRARIIIHFAVFILAAKGISFKKIARCTLLTQGAILLLTLGCYFAGWIGGIDVANPGERVVYSLGYNSPNCLMLVAFQLIFLYGWLRKDRIRLFEYPVLGLFGAAFYWITGGRLGFLCTLLVLLALAVHSRRWMQTLLLKLKGLIKPFAALLCALFLLLTFLYAKYDLTTLNEWTTFRLYFAREAIEEHGVTPFGQQIQWMGQRGSQEDPLDLYNYVDSSYAKALLDYGVIPLLFFLYAFYKQKELLYRKKDFCLLLILLIIEFYCFFESFWIPPIYNTTVLLMKDVLYPLKEKE